MPLQKNEPHAGSFSWCAPGSFWSQGAAPTLRQAAAFPRIGQLHGKGPSHARIFPLQTGPDGLVQRPAAGCAQSPTGRNQMLLFSPADEPAGADSFTQMKQQEKVSTDARMNAYVGCVAKAVTAQVPASYGITSWEVVVFDSRRSTPSPCPAAR